MEAETAKLRPMPDAELLASFITAGTVFAQPRARADPEAPKRLEEAEALLEVTSTALRSWAARRDGARVRACTGGGAQRRVGRCEEVGGPDRARLHGHGASVSQQRARVRRALGVGFA